MQNSSEENRLSKIMLRVETGSIPSKKNHHYPGVNGRVLIDREVKVRMDRLEKGIEFALYSLCQTEGKETDSECLKQLQMRLSNLSDDSLREIPEFSFGMQMVEKGKEGVLIEIEEI